MSSAYALPHTTCSCTKGSMQMEYSGGTWNRSCSDGGTVSCTMNED